MRTVRFYMRMRFLALGRKPRSRRERITEHIPEPYVTYVLECRETSRITSVTRIPKWFGQVPPAYGKSSVIVSYQGAPLLWAAMYHTSTPSATAPPVRRHAFRETSPDDAFPGIEDLSPVRLARVIVKSNWDNTSKMS